MKNLHLILPDLFLPAQFAADMSADLALPALQKLLARATSIPIPPHSVELALCAAFGVAVQNDIPIAPVSAAFDGLGAGCWLRADPVHLRLQRDQMVLSQAAITGEEARQFCASLNEYFAGQGMTFFAPHPQRWYVRVDVLPDMQTTPLSEVLGGNVRGALPRGADAPHWNRVFNESQMLLHAHPLNEIREARGELPINSLWLWGCGMKTDDLGKNYSQAGSDEAMAEMFAAAAGIPYAQLSGSFTLAHLQKKDRESSQLLLVNALRSAIQAGDLHAWRAALQTFETDYAQPLWAALCDGRLGYLRIDVLAGQNSASLVLGYLDTWRFWRRGRRLAMYSAV